MDAAGEILAPLGKKLFVIPGNHESAQQISEFCAKWGFEDAHDRVIDLEGTPMAALGYSNITPFDTPGEYTEEELATKLEKLV